MHFAVETQAGLAQHMFAAPPPDAFGSASLTVEQLIQSISTPLCIIAIAMIGFSALSGRTPIRRGALAIVGCFILLGAAQISQALLQMAEVTRAETSADPLVSILGPPQVLYERPPLPPANQRGGFRGVTTPGE